MGDQLRWPGKSEAELGQAVAARILLNVESMREIDVLARLSREMRQPARVAVRVNPDFELKLSGMKMGGGPKQFGIDAEAVPAALEAIGRLGLAFEGFHIFSGSQNLKAAAICESQQKTIELAIRLAESAPGAVQLEVIVVNDGSTDLTETNLKRHRGHGSAGSRWSTSGATSARQPP